MPSETKTRPALESRFWRRVDKSPRPSKCWLWTGATIDGYGAIGVKGKTHRAHRIAFELERGPIPDGKMVCHHCDNPLCVRPDHLFLGSALHNNLDCVQKGRSARAETHGRARITWAIVRQIREEYAASRTSMRLLGERFGIGRTTVIDIIHNRTWREPASSPRPGEPR